MCVYVLTFCTMLFFSVLCCTCADVVLRFFLFVHCSVLLHTVCDFAICHLSCSRGSVVVVM